MCINCESDRIGRRDLMKFGAAAAIALAAGSVSPAARAADAAPNALSPAEALAALKSGNERFVSHPELCSVDLAQSRSAVASALRRFLTTPEAMHLMRSPATGIPPSRFRPPVYVTIWS